LIDDDILILEITMIHPRLVKIEESRSGRYSGGGSGGRIIADQEVLYDDA